MWTIASSVWGAGVTLGEEGRKSAAPPVASVAGGLGSSGRGKGGISEQEGAFMIRFTAKHLKHKEVAC
jgi:hypothetical protein